MSPMTFCVFMFFNWPVNLGSKTAVCAVSPQTNRKWQSLPCAAKVLRWECNLDWQSDQGVGVKKAKHDLRDFFRVADSLC